MKGSLEIIKPGLMTSIQDMGRHGFATYAIPPSGVMDRNAARIATLLLNLPQTYPVIECTSLAPTIKFLTPTTIAISGADFSWKLNDKEINPNSVLEIQKDDVLRGGFAKGGLRGYIAIKGKLNADKVLGSYSTYSRATMGGYEGRLLKKGSRLTWESEKIPANSFTIKKGPEYEWLDPEYIHELFNSSFKISNDTDRMGMRLSGPALKAKSHQLPYSAPLLPGFIQLPPSGQLIIVLQDGQTTGGYPRIAYILQQDLSRLNQLPLGSKLNFRRQH